MDIHHGSNDSMAAALLAVGLVAGCCGGSNPTTVAATSAVAGTVADGYLVGATVFLDKNGNYQPDAGEPSTTTGADGAYTLNVATADLGRHPIIALAIKGRTMDMDTNQTVPESYLLTLPAEAVSGSVNSNFISPFSTLMEEKMAANPGMTLNEAMIQLRNQMNLPAGSNMMADYVAGARSGSDAARYQVMHDTARKMAALMAGQAGLDMNGGWNLNRYRGMMGTINSNLSAITANRMDSPFLTGMMSRIQAQPGRIPVTGGFGNYSGMFRNMTNHRFFGGVPAGQ